MFSTVNLEICGQFWKNVVSFREVEILVVSLACTKWIIVMNGSVFQLFTTVTLNTVNYSLMIIRVYKWGVASVAPAAYLLRIYLWHLHIWLHSMEGKVLRQIQWLYDHLTFKRHAYDSYSRAFREDIFFLLIEKKKFPIVPYILRFPKYYNRRLTRETMGLVDTKQASDSARHEFQFNCWVTEWLGKSLNISEPIFSPAR